MREDRIEKLTEMSDKLTDLFLDEANPDTWPGEGVLPMEMSKQDRGDRYWCKKNAIATLSIVTRIEYLLESVVRIRVGEDHERSIMLDEEIKRAEKMAEKLLKKAQSKIVKHEA